MPYKELHGVVHPAQLKALESVFEEACRATNILRDSPEAESMALKVMTLFQAGIEDQGQLLAAAIKLPETAINLPEAADQQS